MVAVDCIARVAKILLLLQLNSSLSYGLLCACSDTISTPHPECVFNLECEVARGMCYKQSYRSEESFQTRWDCLDFDASLFIDAFCETLSSSSHVKCCNDTDLCNRNLTTSLPESNIPHEGENNADNDGGNSVVLAPLLSLVFVLLSVFLIVMFACYWRRNCLKLQVAQKTDLEIASIDESHSDIVSCTQTTICNDTLLTRRQLAHDIKLIECIGNGQHHTQLYLGVYQGDRVAVKIFRKNTSERAWLKETDMYTSCFLHHDNILAYLASDIVIKGAMERELWLVTQYHENGSLQAFLMGHTLMPQEVISLARSLCSAIAYLHSDLQTKRPIAHCNITSKNVLVKSNMECCISDFTSAVVERRLPCSMDDFHQGGGTKRYLAPEVLDGSLQLGKFEPVKKIDVYAIGLVLWEMLNRCNLPLHPAGEYEVPFQGLVPPDPSFEEMKRCVVVERRQPTIPGWWSKDDLLGDMVYMLKECWYCNANARPTAVYMKKKMIKASPRSKSQDNMYTSRV